MNKPRRVLHVVARLEQGGIQTWLMDLMKSVDPGRHQFDFFVFHERPWTHEREIHARGGRILACPDYRQPWRLAGALANAVNDHGPYDAIHCHYRYPSIPLTVAARHRVPIRIAHAHSDRRKAPSDRTLPRILYGGVDRGLARFTATDRIAASVPAAEAAFGMDWRRDPSCRVVHCGIDLTPFGSRRSGISRQRFGLPDDALIIGHVGRFEPPKNHHFLIGILADAMRRDSRIHALLIGDGALRTEVESLAEATGIASRIRFLGTRDDVADLLREAIDVFVFPSLWEGLPLAVVEAQAAGVPCIVSDRITDEIAVVPALVERVSLNADCRHWAMITLDRILDPATEPTDALSNVRASSFNIEVSARVFGELYDRAPSVHGAD